MKHFSQEDVMKLKEQEQAGSGGGCLAELFGNLLVFGVVAVLIIAAIAFASTGQPGTAVPTTATAISGPTELVLLPTPTLRPTATSAAPQLAPAIEAVMSPTPAQVAAPTQVGVAPTWTPLPTYTAVPSQTPAATYTPLPTSTPPATWTAVPTFTPFPTWTPPPAPTAVPLPDIQDAISAYGMSSATLTRLTWLVAALITFGFMALLVSVRPFDRDLRRIQRLIEMHLLAALKPPAPVQALPAPVRTTPLAEYLAKRDAPVQNTGYTGVTGANTGAAPPEMITVSVQPAEPEVDTAVAQAICDLWNEIAGRGERPSFNRVCVEYFGSKNSDRLALVRRAVRWGRENGEVLQ